MTATMVKNKYHNVINGKVISGEKDNWMDSIDPATGKAWTQIPLSNEADVDKVCEAASNAFSAWSSLPARQRGDYLRQIGDALSEHTEELLELESKNNGFAMDEYRLTGMIMKQLWYDAAGGASIVGGKGETVQMGMENFGYTLRVPYGVVLGVIPWNMPLFTFTIKAAYALAAGNTVVIKPSQHAAVASLRYGEILSDILPPGVINVICGTGGEIGDALVSHSKVDKVSLTGSTGTAEAMARASASNPKSFIFELGGKSPSIVFDDADLDKAADGVISGIYTRNAGQICAAGSRILIQRSVFNDMLSILKQKMTAPGAVKYGDTLNTDNNMGPIANKPQFKTVCDYIEIGKQEGAEMVFGGRVGGETLLADQPEYQEGYWVEPTLFKAESNDLRICQEEIFGPVAVAIPFDDEEEAVRIANDTVYGLASGVWTNSLQRAHRMVERINAGNVWVNTYGMVGPDLPFGGVKESGFGTDTILEYTREKASVINFG